MLLFVYEVSATAVGKRNRRKHFTRRHKYKRNQRKTPCWRRTLIESSASVTWPPGLVSKECAELAQTPATQILGIRGKSEVGQGGSDTWSNADTRMTLEGCHGTFSSPQINSANLAPLQPSCTQRKPEEPVFFDRKPKKGVPGKEQKSDGSRPAMGRFSARCKRVAWRCAAVFLRGSCASVQVVAGTRWTNRLSNANTDVLSSRWEKSQGHLACAPRYGWKCSVFACWKYAK